MSGNRVDESVESEQKQLQALKPNHCAKNNIVFFYFYFYLLDCIIIYKKKKRYGTISEMLLFMSSVCVFCLIDSSWQVAIVPVLRCKN